MSGKARQFASDNQAPVCPEVWAALRRADAGHTGGYGGDPWTERAVAAVRDVFGLPCEVFFVTNGTAANALAVQAACAPYEAVFCHEWAHLNTDECAAPEFFMGGKVVPVPGDDGKVDLAALRKLLRRGPDIHVARPRCVSVTQCTEVGTVYAPRELAAVREVADEHGLVVHMDGARFANAVAALDVSPKEMIKAGGVDVLSLGGTKNGLMGAEALVFFNEAVAKDFAYRRKRAGQLMSKMRYLSAQWLGILQDGAWLQHAAHANAMAARLHDGLAGLEGVSIVYPRQTNAVFVGMAKETAQALWDKGWKFYEYPEESTFRLMCAWDTQPDDVDALVTDFRAALA